MTTPSNGRMPLEVVEINPPATPPEDPIQPGDVVSFEIVVENPAGEVLSEALDVFVNGEPAGNVPFDGVPPGSPFQEGGMFEDYVSETEPVEVTETMTVEVGGTTETFDFSGGGIDRRLLVGGAAIGLVALYIHRR